MASKDEHFKLTAAYLNIAAAAILTTGVISPTISYIFAAQNAVIQDKIMQFAVPGSIVCSLIMHLAAQYLISKTED